MKSRSRMEDMESFCEWHCFCHTMLARNKTGGLKITETKFTPFPFRSSNGQTKRKVGISPVKVDSVNIPMEVDAQSSTTVVEEDRSCKLVPEVVNNSYDENSPHILDDGDGLRVDTVTCPEESVPESGSFMTDDPAEIEDSPSTPIHTLCAVDTEMKINLDSTGVGITNTCSTDTEPTTPTPTTIVQLNMEENTGNREPITVPENRNKQELAVISSESVAAPCQYNYRNRSNFHKCANCGKTFGQLSSLKWHEKEHNLESAKQFECLKCGKSYSSLASYQNHLKTHKNCLLCGKSIPKSEKEFISTGGSSGLEVSVNTCGRCRRVHSPSSNQIDSDGNDNSGKDLYSRDAS